MKGIGFIDNKRVAFEYELPELPIDQQIAVLKQQLSESDYKAIKYAEGWISDDEYAPIRAARQAIRDKINELESEVMTE